MSWSAAKRWLYRSFVDDTQGLYPAQLVQRRNKAVVGVALFALASTFLGWMVFQGPLEGLPKEDVLRAISGSVSSVSEGTERHMRHDIYVTLDGAPFRFVYIAKAGDRAAVLNALCRGCMATIWIDSTDNHPSRIIFQLAVKGRIVRSYRDIKTAWVADNSIGPWMEGFFLFYLIYLAAYALRVQRRLNAFYD